MSQTFIIHKDVSRINVVKNLIMLIEALSETCAWSVEVKRYMRTRSSEQNRYLNGVAYKLLSEHTGYDRDDISEYLCGEYWGWLKKRKPGKKLVDVPVRTTTTNEDGKREVLGWDEFWDYVDYVQRFGSKHGVYIPDPDQSYKSYR